MGSAQSGAAMPQCLICRIESALISKSLGVCLACIRERPEHAMPMVAAVHAKTRAVFSLPEKPPKAPEGKPCRLCVNQCTIGEGETGYCGVRYNEDGHLIGVSATEGKLSWYHDPLPTNCVGSWSCAGGTGAGYPAYAYRNGPERGYQNLAVFFHACTFNCLFCQNWHFRKQTLSSKTAPIEDLVSDVHADTACICYFGGDPTPQLPYALKASKRALKENRDRILRICWETNGSMHPRLLDQMMDLALETGGCIKFDLKAWNDHLHRSLTGVTNRRTIENFRWAGRRIAQRPNPPPLVVATLLVPGYLDEQEIRGISSFIASIDPDIPYSLLAFHPQFFFSDLPLPTHSFAQKCFETAVEAGLKNVRIGNRHLLTQDD